MSFSHAGEILLKEKYGTTSQERYYVKPAEQSVVVVVDDGICRNLSTWFARVFLPQGYPDSVTKDYINYQVWDTAQAFCSTMMGTLATQEVLRGVGVGNDAATPMAATVTWVLKDGCGHVGRILFAYYRGTHLDAYSKKWRLYADMLNDAAMCIEMSLPAFRGYTTLALCSSTAMRAIVGVAGGATRVALTQHHALRNNLADVSAKDSAQETAVNLIASFCALAVVSLVGQSVSLFLLLMLMHITCNYLAVRAVCLRTLNEPRYLQVINAYLRQELIPAPCIVNKHEPIVFYQMGINCLDYKMCGFTIKLGQSVGKLTREHTNAHFLRQVIEVYKRRNYVLCPFISRRQMYVLLREDASVDDVLLAYFHAVLLSTVICAINNVPLGTFENTDDLRPFGKVCQFLQTSDWSRDNPDEAGANLLGLRYNPSPELMTFVDNMVSKEWERFSGGLRQTGWDTTKHLLLIDEWRVMDPVVTSASVKTVVGKRTPVAKEEDNSIQMKNTWDQNKKISIQNNLHTEKDKVVIKSLEIEKSKVNAGIENLKYATDKKTSFELNKISKKVKTLSDTGLTSREATKASDMFGSKTRNALIDDRSDSEPKIRVLDVPRPKEQRQVSDVPSSEEHPRISHLPTSEKNHEVPDDSNGPSPENKHKVLDAIDEPVPENPEEEHEVEDVTDVLDPEKQHSKNKDQDPDATRVPGTETTYQITQTTGSDFRLVFGSGTNIIDKELHDPFNLAKQKDKDKA